jgi:hypothetical protein
MRITHLPLVLALLVLAVTSSAEQGRVFEVVCDGAVDRGIVVSRESLTEVLAERLANAFMREHSASRIVSLIIGVDREQVLRSHRGPVAIFDSASRDIHANVARELEERKKALNSEPLARVIGFRGIGSLVFRGHGKVRQVTLGGDRDPAVFEAAGTQYQLLHMNLTRGGPAAKHYCQLKLFWQSAGPELSISGFTGVLRQIRSWGGPSNIVASLRRDPWFLADPGFPVTPWFAQDLRFPDPLTWLSAPSLTCSFEGNRLTCGGEGFAP